MRRKISIVLPCLNEEGNLLELNSRIKDNIPGKYSYEIIYVDDGSTDNTSKVVKMLCSKSRNTKGIIFYKRFGHQAALKAGIGLADGDAVITMDSDFQHPPKMIPKLINKWESGHDLVQAKKKEDKGASIIDKVGRAIGYFFWDKVSDGTLTPGVSDFRIMSKSIRDYVVKSEEKELFLRGIVMLGAKNPCTVEYNVGKRKYGKSSYTAWKFANMFLTGLVSYSPKPLRIAFVIGGLILLFTSIFLVYSFLNALFTGRQIIEGWVTAIIVVLVLNGFTILYIGIIGEYIGIVFREVKKRPMFLIEEKINF